MPSWRQEMMERRGSLESFVSRHFSYFTWSKLRQQCRIVYRVGKEKSEFEAEGCKDIWC